MDKRITLLLIGILIFVSNIKGDEYTFETTK